MLKKAVFCVNYDKDKNLVSATTRPNSEKIGLIGGKIDEGESLFEAIKREAKEEGWHIELYDDSFSILNSCMLKNDLMVFWVELNIKEAKILTDYKEKDRINPIWVTPEQIINSGYRNEFLKDYFLSKNKEINKQRI